MDFLPPECLLHIFKFIPGDSLLQCSLVSRKFNQIIKNNGNSLQKQKMLLLRITRDTEQDNVLVISEIFSDYSEMCVGFVQGSQENANGDVFYKKGSWIGHKKAVETQCLLTTLNSFLCGRMARTEYKSLITRYLSDEEFATIGELLDRHKMKVEELKISSANKTQLDAFLATETAKQADFFYLSTINGHYFIPDDVFKQLSFTRFRSSIIREDSVFLTFSQIILILKEWKECRRKLNHMTFFTPAVEKDTFHTELAGLGFVNEDHRESSFKIILRGNTLMTLKWQMANEHIFMNFVAEVRNST